MSLPVVSNPKPIASWKDPTLDVNGQPLVPGDTPTQYLVGIRDLGAPGSAAGAYPNTFLALGGAATSAPLSSFVGLTLVSGHSYAVAVEAQVGSNGLQSSWSAEYQFTYQPLAAPASPTGISVQ